MESARIERLRSRLTEARGLAVATCACIAAIPGLVHPAEAAAGVYHVYSCRTPWGAPAPADGWSGSKTGVYTFTENTCSQPGGALIAAMGDEIPRETNTDISTWAFAAPAGEKIAAARLWRAGDADGGADVGSYFDAWLAGPSNLPNPTDAFDACESGITCPDGRGTSTEPLSPGNLVMAPEVNLGTHLYVDASCVGQSGRLCAEGQHDANGYAALINLYAADFELEQNGGPSVGSVSGELATAATVRGESDVLFDASDPGSGVYEAVFDVDGNVVERTVVDGNGGRCVDVGGTGDGSPAFLYTQPCRGSVSVDVGFDSSRVANGTHRLVVTVTDAAGNSAPVLDREITISNPAPLGGPNGSNASSSAALTVGWQGTSRARLVSGYGRVHTILGRLAGPGGVAIAGAQLDCSVTAAYAGAKAAPLSCPRTGADGRFTVRLPRGSDSGKLAFAYRAHLGDALPVATRTLSLAVRAGVSLRVSPHTASVGRRILFSGRLLGGPIPHGGKQLVLEARSPGGPWIEFDVVRTDRRGRYRSSYRFKFAGPVSYRFRAVSELDADYPYSRGSSNVVGVYEH